MRIICQRRVDMMIDYHAITFLISHPRCFSESKGLSKMECHSTYHRPVHTNPKYAQACIDLSSTSYRHTRTSCSVGVAWCAPTRAKSLSSTHTEWRCIKALSLAARTRCIRTKSHTRRSFLRTLRPDESWDTVCLSRTPWTATTQQCTFSPSLSWWIVGIEWFDFWNFDTVVVYTQGSTWSKCQEHPSITIPGILALNDGRLYSSSPVWYYLRAVW